MSFADLPPEQGIAEMSFPTRVVVGAGALARLPAHVGKQKMARPLVVTDQGVVKAGLASAVYKVLTDAKVSFGVFEAVKPDPTEKDVFDGLESYRKQGCDGIIALGGGSPLDAAKLIQLSTTHPPPLSRYDDAKGGDQYVENNLPPLIAIPTTAGTGSEVSRSAVATLADTGRKTVIFSPYLLPRVAICDPELTLGLPPGPTAATGMDAFTHCLEAYVSKPFHPLADALAIDGMRRVARSLREVYRNGKNVGARADMMVAAMEGAMAFQKGLGACHALAHALTPLCGLHHGLANAIVLPFVMEFNRSASAGRLADIGTILNGDANAPVAERVEAAISGVRELNQALGIPARLRDAGMKEEVLAQVSKRAFEDASHLANPRPCTEADLLTLARAAF